MFLKLKMITSGHYMYLSGWSNTVGKLRTPNFPMSGYDCVLQLSYYIQGTGNDGSIAVEVQAARGKEVK